MTDLDIENRIIFHTDLQVMEVNFSDLTFNVSKPVNAFYDEIDRQLKASGQKWFFLVNYRNCRIMSEAWIAFAHRGKKTNIGYSLGSVRFATSDDTGKAILDRSRKEHFDPNLFPSREVALAQLAEMRGKIPIADFAKVILKADDTSDRSINERVTFLHDLEIMEVDFSAYTFATGADVNEFYDAIATMISETKQKWFFMVNYSGTEILPGAWYQWAIRGKQLNKAHSLGTVRYTSHDAAEKEILKRAQADSTDPNLVSTRDEALARIADMK